MLGTFVHLHSVSVHRSQLRQNWQSLNSREPPDLARNYNSFVALHQTDRTGGEFLDAKRRTRTAAGPAQDFQRTTPGRRPAGISIGADRSHLPTEQERSSAGAGSRTPASGWRLAVDMMIMFALGICCSRSREICANIPISVVFQWHMPRGHTLSSHLAMSTGHHRGENVTGVSWSYPGSSCSSPYYRLRSRRSPTR